MRSSIRNVGLATIAVTVAAGVAMMLRSGAQARPADDRNGHESGPVDPPRPPTIHRRTRPAIASLLTPGLPVSVQVNVDEEGRNIVGDAANEPSIAIDPMNPDRMVIGWRQFDSIESNFREAGYAYSRDGGQTWTFPGVLEEGAFRSDPVLAADPDGVFYYLSYEPNVHGTSLFRSTDGGASWAGPFNALGGDKPWFAFDRTGGIGGGNFYEVWSMFASCCPGNFTRSTDGGNTYSEPFIVTFDGLWATVDVAPDGAVYLAFNADDDGEAEVFRSSNAQDPNEIPVLEWATRAFVGGRTRFGGDDSPNPGGLLGQVWVAIDHSDGPTRGNVYVLGTFDRDPTGQHPTDVMFIRSSDRGVTWTEPVRVHDDPEKGEAWQWFGTMSVAPSGRIDVVWNDTRNFPGAYTSELFYAFSTDGGDTWSKNVAISPPFDPHLGWPQQDKLGDYYHTISDDAGVSIAYAATFNGEQDVYFLRLELSCEGDVDEDGAVGFSDLLLVLAAWGPCPHQSGCPEDLDDDDQVGFSDLLIVLAAWGPCE